jgi:hypothetical protein
MRILIIALFFTQQVFANLCQPAFTPETIKRIHPCMVFNTISLGFFLAGLLSRNSTGAQLFICPDDYKETHIVPKINYLKKENLSKCQFVKRVTLANDEKLNIRKPKCANAIHQLFLKSLTLPINSFYTEKFSEYCDYRNLWIDTYCCSNQHLTVRSTD